MAMIQLPFRCDEELRDAIELVIETPAGRVSRDQYLRDVLAKVPEIAGALKQVRGETTPDRATAFRQATQ